MNQKRRLQAPNSKSRAPLRQVTNLVSTAMAPSKRRAATPAVKAEKETKPAATKAVSRKRAAVDEKTMVKSGLSVAAGAGSKSFSQGTMWRAGESDVFKKLGIKTFTMQVRSRLGCPVMSRYSHGAPPVPTQHVDKYGIGKIMEMSLDHLASQVWLTCRAHVASVS